MKVLLLRLILNLRIERIFSDIIGGEEAEPHSIPFIAQLFLQNHQHCGGSLIRMNDESAEGDIVVTAAHCMYG